MIAIKNSAKLKVTYLSTSKNLNTGITMLHDHPYKPTQTAGESVWNTSLATTCLYPAPKSIWGFSIIRSVGYRKAQLPNCTRIFSNTLMGVLIPAYAAKSDTGVTHLQTGARYFGTHRTYVFC